MTAGKKRILIGLLAGSMLLASACGGAAAGGDGTVSETNTPDESYFKWDDYGENENIIIGLTEEGQKQKKLIIPARCEGFGGSVFAGSLQTESVEFESSKDIVLSNAFMGSETVKSVSLPEKLTTISDQAFSSAYALETIVIPEGVTQIGEDAFCDCQNLKEVVFQGQAVTELGASAFSGCVNLAEVTLPDSITDIQDHCFYRCESLTALTLPKNVKTLDRLLLMRSAVKDIYIPAEAQMEAVAEDALQTGKDTSVHVQSGSWAADRTDIWEGMGLTVVS